jgi:hypothetical protein
MQTIVIQIVTVLLGLLSKEAGKKVLDKLFDFIEDLVADSSTKIDDIVVLPLIAKAREILDVPDYEDEATKSSGSDSVTGGDDGLVDEDPRDKPGNP